MARTSLQPALARQPLPFIHVLLVEDNPSDACLISRLLEDDGAAAYSTHHVKTQAEALEALLKHTFDVCLLDLTLPDANGFSALIDIQEKAPQLPVLILTGMNDMELAKRAVGRGAQDYLLKDETEIDGLTRAIDYGMERKRAEKGLFQRANCDALTGLANRESFLVRLELALARARRSGLGVAVLFIDLNRFKPINDTYGHDAGDETLKTVAQRLRATLRAYDASARLGGDEFAVLLEEIGRPRHAAAIAQKIADMLAVPVAYEGHKLDISASIGIAVSDESVTVESLLQNADTAMYHAKKNGSAYHFYAESMHKETQARLRMEEDLRTALAKEEVRLHYQPCIDKDGQTVLGVEALLRWAYPKRGMLLAHEFLPAAEEARLMPQVAKFVCAQLRRDITLWNESALPPMVIAINLSPSQLDMPDLLEWLTPIAQKNFLGHHRLAVEIPEEAVVSLSQARFITIGKINALGIDLHLDHFGRGACPLSALHTLPFSLLKLDMSLIKSMSGEVSQDVLIRAAIMLAHQFGIKAGAVGVETPWQMATLKAQACDAMQGYLTTQPMAARQLVEWLAQR